MKKIFCLMFMICSLFILVGCQDEAVIEEKPKEEPVEEVKHISHFMGELNVLGMASIKEFKTSVQPHKAKHFSSNHGQVKEFSDEQPIVAEGVTYPFDYVKIHSAIKFSISIPENAEEEALEMLQTSCGLGDLDVIIADFSTFILQEDKEILQLECQDQMITIVGKKGLYTILTNSGSYQYDQGEKYFSKIFSSHKTIDSNGINKDFLPPFYGINVKYGYDGIYDVSFTKEENIASENDFSLSNKYEYDATKVESVARDTMYSVLELTSYPQEWMEGDIISINQEASYFTISVEGNTFVTIYLSKEVVLEDNTLEMDSIWELLGIDVHIAVRYDYWYSGYEPTEVYANTLKLFIP